MFHKRLGEALSEDDYKARFDSGSNNPRADATLCQEDWDMLFSRRRLLALLRPGANAFLRMRPTDEPFCPQQLWAVIMRMYLGCYVYDDSAGPDLALCGHCGLHVLDRMGIHATTYCSAGWGRVARHDRLAKLYLRWLASPAGLAFQGKYFRGEANGLLFGTASRPADALIFPSLPGPGATIELPTAIDFMVSGNFSTASATACKDARRAAASSDAILDNATAKKETDFRKKVVDAWKMAHPTTPLPGSHPDAPMPQGGLAEVTGFRFRPAIFDTFGGCSEGTAELIMDHAKLVAAREGRKPMGVFKRVYGRFSFCIWSFNAQAVILRRPRTIQLPS